MVKPASNTDEYVLCNTSLLTIGSSVYCKMPLNGPSAQAVMEVKTTAGEGFRITRAILDKLVRQAGSKVPILSIEFVGGKNPQTWVMYPSFKIEGL